MLLALSVSLRCGGGSIAEYGIASTLFLCGLTGASFGLLRFLIYAVSLTPLQKRRGKDWPPLPA